MKTLHQLKKECVLLASFNQPSYVAFDGYPAHFYRHSNKVLLFYDNHGVYYLYLYVLTGSVHTFCDQESAYLQFNSLVRSFVYSHI